MANSKASSLGEGVFYEPGDYPGYLRRLLAMAVDFLFLGLVAQVLWHLLGLFIRDQYDAFWMSFLLFIWLYLTIVKASPMLTIGYRLAGVKIVNLKGERPSVFRMTFRLMLWTIGPLNLLYDLAWLSADSDRQTLRDCIAGTYVIRNGTEPAGSGPLHLARYTALGFTLTYPRVQHRKPKESS